MYSCPIITNGFRELESEILILLADRCGQKFYARPARKLLFACFPGFSCQETSNLTVERKF